MRLFVCIFDDARLLTHFLRHYAGFGVTEFHVAAPPELADEVTALALGYDVVQYNDLNVADSYVGGITAVTEMRRLAQGPEEWAVIADLDEFAEFGQPAPEIARDAESEGANLVRGVMYDRLAEDGRPKAFSDGSDLPSLFPVRARLTRDLMGGEDIKGVLVKGGLRGRGAHHIFEDERPHSRILEISHYKWFDGSLERVELAYRLNLDAGNPWFGQYKMILDHYAAHGRLAWETFGGELVGGST